MRRPPWPLVMWMPVRTTQLWIVCCTRSCTRDGRWRGAQATARRPTHPRHAGSRGRPCPPPRGAAQARGCHPIKMTAMVGGGLARRMGYRVGPSPSPCRQIGVETMGNPREPTVSRGGTLRLSRTERRRLFSLHLHIGTQPSFMEGASEGTSALGRVEAGSKGTWGRPPCPAPPHLRPAHRKW